MYFGPISGLRVVPTAAGNFTALQTKQAYSPAVSHEGRPEVLHVD